MMSKVTPLFAVPLYKSKIDLSDRDIKSVEQLNYVQSLNHDNSMITKDNDLHLEHSSVFPIFNKIRHYIDDFIFKHYQVDYNTHAVSIIKGWGVRLDPNNTLNRHCHTQSVFGGVVYVKCPPDSGNLILEDTGVKPTIENSVTPSYSEHNRLNSKEFGLRPQQGDIFMFPSWVYHSVTQNMSDQPRYSLAFDFIIKRK